MLKRFLAALSVIFILASPALAFDTPKALVEAIYAGYKVGSTPPDPKSYFSGALTYLLEERIAKEGAESEVLGFDPFINGQDHLLHDVVISEPVVVSDRALVNVKFHNFDEPTALSLSLIEENDGWKVDDIASLGVERHWLLSWLLAFDPFAVN